MTTAAEYETRIASFDWPALQVLWERIQKNSTHPDWAPGKTLEYLVLRAFRLGGAQVTWPYGIRSQYTNAEVEQIDGVVYYNEIITLIECKDKREPLDYTPIAKLKGQLTRRPGNIIGSIVSRNGFTPNGIELTQIASPQNVLLWEGAEIEYGIQQKNLCSALEKKYRVLVEQALPNYNSCVPDG